MKGGALTASLVIEIVVGIFSDAKRQMKIIGTSTIVSRSMFVS